MALLKKKFYDDSPLELEDVDVQPAVAEGENYAGPVYRITLRARLGSGRQKKMSMFVKRFPSGGPLGDVLQHYDLYRNEAKVYNLFPSMDELMEEFGDRRERLWCNSYGYHPHDTLALEDLEGFVTGDRKQWHTPEKAAYVLRALGRLHAMSKVLMGRGIISKDDGASSHFMRTESQSFRKVMPGCLQVLSSAIEESWDDQWKGLAKRVRNQMPLICDELQKVMNTSDPRFDVLNHGDPWTNNIMWKFTEYGNLPTALRFVDFQFSIVYSFIYDVAYYLNCCLSSTMRRKNMKLLFEMYQESLEKNLKFFDWKGYIPTLEDVYSEFDRIQYLHFALLIYSLPVTTGTADVTYDLANVLTKSPEEFLAKSMYTEDKYAKEVCTDLQELWDKGVI